MHLPSLCLISFAKYGNEVCEFVCVHVSDFSLIPIW
jgi:hypothetical protein